MLSSASSATSSSESSTEPGAPPPLLETICLVCTTPRHPPRGSFLTLRCPRAPPSPARLRGGRRHHAGPFLLLLGGPLGPHRPVQHVRRGRRRHQHGRELLRVIRPRPAPGARPAPGHRHHSRSLHVPG